MTAPTLPLEVRCNLIDALQIDLIGPTGPLGNHYEILAAAPLTLVSDRFRGSDRGR
jgi:hypothetical protein